MKFCYLDESGTGSERFAIMASVIVDATRMHVTKSDWDSLLVKLSKIVGREVKEFHSRDFYRGNSCWRNLKGAQRAEIISAIFEWLKSRRHAINFSGVDKTKFYAAKDIEPKLSIFHSVWCFLGLHQILTIQKVSQRFGKNKGNTVFIFDNEIREQTHFAKLIKSAPEWVHLYYSVNKRKIPFDQIIDVPYYGDSEDVNLIQVADLMAYLLRRYVEIKENVVPPQYHDEKEKIELWVNNMVKLCLPVSTRYPSVGRDACSEVFYTYAPASLVELGR
jgi:hypothetical protein